MDNMYISLSDLLYFMAGFTIFCVFLAAGILLIFVLIKLNKLLKQVNSTLDANRENIDNTLKILPETVKNINDISVTIKTSVDKAGLALDSAGDAVKEAAAAVSERSGSLLDYIKIFGEVIAFVKKIFSSSSEE